MSSDFNVQRIIISDISTSSGSILLKFPTKENFSFDQPNRTQREFFLSIFLVIHSHWKPKQSASLIDFLPESRCDVQHLLRARYRYCLDFWCREVPDVHISKSAIKLFISQTIIERNTEKEPFTLTVQSLILNIQQYWLSQHNLDVEFKFIDSSKAHGWNRNNLVIEKLPVA